MAPKVNKPHTEKKRRTTLKLSDKLDIIKKIERGVSRSVLMAEYNIGSSTLYDIKHSKHKLLEFIACSEPNEKIADRKSLHKPKLESLDKVLYEWFLLKRSEGVSISGPMIIAKAKDFKEKMGIDTTITFTDGWLTKFKMRHGIRKLDPAGEKRSSVATEAAKEPRVTLEKLVNDNSLIAHQIYNADETSLFWKCLPQKSLAGFSEKKAGGFKQNQERVTILLCANASGQHRIKPLVIGKYHRPRTLKGIMHLPVTYKVQKDARMDKEIFQHWFTHEFVPAVRKNLHDTGKSPDSKCVLLLDNCKAYPHESKLVSDCGNIFSCYLPPSATSLIQPTGQGVIQNFKCRYRNDFVKRMISKDTSILNFQQGFTIKDAIYSVAIAWNAVHPVTLRLWRKLWPSVTSADVPSDDGSIEGFNSRARQSIIEEIMQTVQSTSTENPLHRLEVGDIEAWLAVDDHLELSQSFPHQESMDPEKRDDTLRSDTEEDDVDTTEKVTWAVAELSMENILRFFEQNPSFTMEEVMQAHILRNAMITKKRASVTQSDIRKLLKKAVAFPKENRQGNVPSATEEASEEMAPSTSKADTFEGNQLDQCFSTYLW